MGLENLLCYVFRKKKTKQVRNMFNLKCSVGKGETCGEHTRSVHSGLSQFSTIYLSHGITRGTRARKGCDDLVSGVVFCCPSLTLKNTHAQTHKKWVCTTAAVVI